jgi:hypothetical protein
MRSVLSPSLGTPTPPQPLRCRPGESYTKARRSSQRRWGTGRDPIARLEVVLSHVRSQGYRVIEGERLRGQRKDASALAAQRAHELMRSLTDLGRRTRDRVASPN